jgi:hypothetical protein
MTSTQSDGTIPFHRMGRDSMAHMQFMRRLIVLLPLLPRKIVAIPTVVNRTDAQEVKIAEELAAFDIDQADPVEFSPARGRICRAVRFGCGGGATQIPISTGASHQCISHRE